MLNKQELLLVAVMEECSEIAKRASKSLRFGIHEQKEGKKNNLQLIAEETVDLIAVLEMLDEELYGEFDQEINKLKLSGAYTAKKNKFQKYIEYSQSKGCVEYDKEEVKSN